VEIQRDDRKAMNIKKTRLPKKYYIEVKESLDQLTEELKQKVPPRRSDYLGTRKDKLSTNKISCLE
jgi:hypothetical protein